MRPEQRESIRPGLRYRANTGAVVLPLIECPQSLAQRVSRHHAHDQLVHARFCRLEEADRFAVNEGGRFAEELDRDEGGQRSVDLIDIGREVPVDAHPLRRGFERE